MGHPDSARNKTLHYLKTGEVETPKLTEAAFIKYYTDHIGTLKYLMKEFTAPKIADGLGNQFSYSGRLQLKESRAVKFLDIMLYTDGYRFFVNADGDISLVHTAGEWLNRLTELSFDYRTGIDVAYVYNILQQHRQSKVDRFSATPVPSEVEIALVGINSAMETLRRTVQKKIDRINTRINTVQAEIDRDRKTVAPYTT